jgi:rhodanese-related sulfurtransferase
MKAFTRAALVAAAFLVLGSASGFAEDASSGGPISPDKAKALIASDPKVVLLDVRTKEEFAEGRIPGAILLPYDAITEKTARASIPSKSSVVVVYCRSGRRSAIAVERLRSLGYATVWDLGGINRWPYEVVR